MMRTNDQFALKTAIELAKVNIEASGRWVAGDAVNRFIQEVSDYLSGTDSPAEEQ